MRRRMNRLLAVTLLSLAVCSCVISLNGDKDDPKETVLSLALSLKNAGSSQSPATKMTATITQSGSSENFRGIEEVFVVPFRIGDGSSPVASGNERLGTSNVSISNPGIAAQIGDAATGGLVRNNYSHLYNFVTMPRGMNRVLVYGKAIDDGDVSTRTGKHRNGVLNPVGLDDPSTAGDISFSLEQIASAGDINAAIATADDLIAALNGLVAAIRSADVPAFNRVFEYAENKIWSCSFQSFHNIRDNVQSTIFGYSGAGASQIVSAINTLDGRINAAGSAYPSSYGIPEGALGFWWNGQEFIRLINSVNIALVPVESYAYPPSLWYYANSSIKATSAENVEQAYVSSNTTWGSILICYDPGSSEVGSSTRSVAVVDQLQYGVALLDLSIGEAFSGATSATDFPLTGILIGDQKDVDFAFTPKISASRYVYDNQVSGLYLGTAGGSVKTLLLQTAQTGSGSQDTVHFALEFQNNTTASLPCQQGQILPGCKFYLAGELVPGNGTPPTGATEPITSVFCQDHVTSVSVRVVGLESAYNTVPDLHAPQLEIGLVAEMKWTQVSPGSVKLNL